MRRNAPSDFVHPTFFQVGDLPGVFAGFFAGIREPRSAPSSSWAACIKRVYEIDPLACPKCQAQMRIVAFMHDPVVIANITRSLGLPDFTAPPKIPRRRRAGEQLELCADAIPNDEV
jgi:hypothetical protein